MTKIELETQVKNMQSNIDSKDKKISELKQLVSQLYTVLGRYSSAMDSILRSFDGISKTSLELYAYLPEANKYIEHAKGVLKKKG
jgi:division protein CdvB (Snf7/Vps24/ESCRT-III family)